MTTASRPMENFSCGVVAMSLIHLVAMGSPENTETIDIVPRPHPARYSPVEALVRLSSEFNWVQYLRNYPDLRAKNISTEEDATKHNISYGKTEGQHSFPLENYEKWLEHRTPLPIVLDSSEPVRLNILMCGVGYDFTGGPLSIFHFAVLAAKQGINVRWININNAGITEQEMVTHMKKYDGLA